MTGGSEENMLCERCADIDLAKVLRGGYKMPQKIRDFGTVTTAQIKSPCPLCRLVAEAITNPFGDPSLASFHDTCGFCTPSPTDEGDSLGSYQLVAENVAPITQRDGMGHGQMAKFQDAYLITNPIQQEVTFSRMEPQTDPQPLDKHELEHGAFIALKVVRIDNTSSNFISYYGSIYPVGGVKEGMSLARLLSSSTDWDLLRSYLSACDCCHSKCSSSRPRPLIHGFCLIDCDTRKLVPAVDGTGYVALSYVWGAPEKNARMEVPKIGDRLFGAPLVIEDAMSAVKNLGYRYLWVDRFCIQQNDSVSLQDHLAKMHLIYQGALFTIVAAAGTDSSWGLPGVSSRPRKLQAQATIDGYLLATAVEPFPGSSSCKWKTRAWTYQEELFSTRKLIFGPNQVSFHCLQSEHSEIYTSPALLPASMSMRTGSHTTSIWEHIENYSKRDLTYDSDALDGLKATLNSFTESAKESVRNLWGIPFAKTIDALDHDHPSNRAGTSRTTGLLSSAIFASASAIFGYGLSWKMSGNTPPERRTLHRRTDFPTWSWASCFGHVVFPRLPWLAMNQPVMPDPELEVAVAGPDDHFTPISLYLCKYDSHEPSRYLRLSAWSVRDALTFHLSEGIVLLDLGDTDHELSGSIQLDSLSNHCHKKISEILSESQNSQKRWEAIITWLSPCPANEAIIPFILILIAVDDSYHSGQQVYERIGSIPTLEIARVPKNRRIAAASQDKTHQTPRPSMKWAAKIIEELEEQDRKNKEWVEGLRLQSLARQTELESPTKALASGQTCVPSDESDSESSDADSWDMGDYTINMAIRRGLSKKLYPRIPMVRKEIIIG